MIEGKGATNYAIGLAGARLVEALLSPTRSVLPVSSVLDGQYGISGIALSLPTLVSEHGIDRVLEAPMSADEVSLLHASAERIRQTAASVGF